MFSQSQVALYHPKATVAPLRQLLGELLQLEDVSRHMLELATGVGIHYPGMAAVAGGDPHPLVGRRVPDGPLTGPDGPSTIFAALRDGQGVLLDLTEGTAARELASGWADRVPTVSSATVAGIDATVVLVRPDGYVAYAGRDVGDGAGLLRALSTWFGAPVTASASAG
jgi:hypothetical protein